MDVIRRLAATLPRGATLLEFGCGETTKLFDSLGLNVTVVDNDPARIAEFARGALANCCDSLDYLPKGNFDAMFLDGDHRFSRFQHELRIARMYCDTGLIVGHHYDAGSTWDARWIEQDIGEDGRHHGVLKALEGRQFQHEGRVWWMDRRP